LLDVVFFYKLKAFSALHLIVARHSLPRKVKSREIYLTPHTRQSDLIHVNFHPRQETISIHKKSFNAAICFWCHSPLPYILHMEMLSLPHVQQGKNFCSQPDTKNQVIIRCAAKNARIWIFKASAGDVRRAINYSAPTALENKKNCWSICVASEREREGCGEGYGPKSRSPRDLMPRNDGERNLSQNALVMVASAQ